MKPTTEILTPDICIIGAGSAGLTAAAAAAAFGQSVVLIEKGEMGGDCLNYGCVPSKALIAAAKQAHAIGRAHSFGIRAPRTEIDFALVHRHVREVIAAIEPNDSAERFTGLGVKVIRAAARFKDKRTVTADGTEIRARRFIVATGSRPAVPAIPGLGDVPYLTNETIFNLTLRPAHLAIIGGGPIGMEMAQAFRRLGSAVTVLQSGRILPKDDPEMAAILRGLLRAEGVDIRENAEVTRVAQLNAAAVEISLADGGSVAASHLLVATGRTPNVGDLGLAAAGIAHNENGIRVDRRMRTRNRRVYAVGDVTHGYRFTHWAGYQAGLALRSILFRFGGPIRPELLSWATYTDPELAHVGLSEAEARRRHRGVQVLRWPFAENDRAQTERATHGHVKIVTTRHGRILGAEILGRNAGELIALWALAASQKMKVQALIDTVLPYPTFSEAAKRAAIAFYTPKLGSALVRRTIRFLRPFG